MDMQMAFKLQRRRLSDPGILPVGTTLEMATINGYRALGLEETGGSIEVGKKADLVVVDTRKPHLRPLTMPVHQLVYYANGADVEHVFVDGEQVVEDGRVTTIDVEGVFAAADDQLARLASVPGSPIPRLTEDAVVWGRSRADGVTL
jgi:5-methylthioadenosine/S-adenosylhomocysteine deaminase